MSETVASIESLSPEQIEERQRQLLDAVPESQGIGNKALREALGTEWSEDLYWAIRKRLIETGALEPGRGRGGSVKRTLRAPEVEGASLDSKSSTAQEDCVSPPDYVKELDLYEPIANVLRNQWAREQGFDSYLVEVTAKQGSKQTGGKWTRPDITVVGHKTFPYVPGRFLEVVTFEVKPCNTTDVASVYEALAHRRASTRAYVMAHIPHERREDYESVLEAICEEAKKFGVGVAVAEQPDDFDAWEFLLDAERFEPDPARLNEFIAQQASQSLKEQVIRWFK
jgi:hypothetical protein